MMKLSSLAGLLGLALSLIASAAQAQPARAAAQAQERIVLPADATPDRYDIAIVPDAQHLSFTGSVRIGLNVRRPTSRIVLNAADLSFDRVALSGRAEVPKVSFDKAQETAALAFSRLIVPGHYTLSIDYRGKINEHAAGLFSLDYTANDGRRERALFTQFENSDARRFVPSWDEPAQKAVFSLTATVPQDLMAVSNMPAATSEAVAGGLKRVRFADTPKMSSYLLFFGLGDFERVSRKVGATDVGVVVKRGDRARGAFALDTAVQLLPYYNGYFGVNYPLPKLDLIAGPGRSQFFGAMENWGAIFYFEQDMLIDPKISTQADRQNVYMVVAHEMAHQWFGDLVTMAWWDDLWLNEGFASWMEVKASDHFHPEWNLWLSALGDKEAAMRLDARAGTHPIIQPIRDVLQANQAFDTITYQKGQAVIRMLEAYAGEDAWRAGVRGYMRRYAYGNTVTDDLWREMDATSKAGPISGIAHDFTLQAGVPLIRATASPCAGHVLNHDEQLTESRFAVDEAGRAAQSWRIPVEIADLNRSQARRIVVSSAAPARIGLIGCPGDMLVNAGQTAYFHTLYRPESFSGLAGSFARLSPYDQLGMINDSWALGEAGYEPVGDFLTLATRLPADANPVVWQELIGAFAEINALYNGLPEQAAFQAFARRLLAPVFARVGFDPKPGEASNVALLRGELLTALGALDDPAVLAEARRRFAAYLGAPDSLSPGTRRAVLRIVARQADPATWEELHQLARQARTPLEKAELYDLLGASRNPDLARRTLALALSNEPEKTIGPSIIAAVSAPFPELAFDYATARIDRVNEALEPDSRNQYVPGLVSNSVDPGMTAKLNAYAAKRIPATARAAVVKAASSIAFRARVRREILPQISQWTARHGG